MSEEVIVKEVPVAVNADAYKSQVQVRHSHVFKGRKKILVDDTDIDEFNVLSVLREAVNIHNGNQWEIDYLYNYYRGEQPILQRIKTVRPEINNMIVENRANEIVSFKVGYLMGEPLQYVAHCENEEITDDLNELNEYMFVEDKPSKDKELADWMHICGTGYRMVLPADIETDGVPFKIYTLDPRYTFVVYSNVLGEPPLMAVKFILKKDGNVVYSVYTKNRYFEIVNDEIVVDEFHAMQNIPIIEYPLNNARLGAFEIVLELLDAINDTASNRQDGIDQFVQSLMRFHNVDISSEDFMQLKYLGAIKYKDIDPGFKAEVDYITSELNQTQTETLVKHQYNTVLEIVGMPSVADGSTSDSSNNGAIILKNGWQNAEARAKDTELMFKLSEKKFLQLVLWICRNQRRRENNLDLRLGNIEVRFTRRQYENLLSKAQVFQTLISQEKLAPEYAFTQSGLFLDPMRAYTESMKYYEEQKEIANRESENDTTDSGDLREAIE